jgi:hypothetical protein
MFLAINMTKLQCNFLCDEANISLQNIKYLITDASGRNLQISSRNARKQGRVSR